jgi:hypothetical protein
MEGRSDGFTAIEDQYADYTVYDPDGDMIGKVDDHFVDENDQPEYIGVKIGLLGTGSTLILWEMVEVREADSSLIVSADDDHVKDGPTFDDDKEITPSSRTRFTLTTACSEQAAPRSATPTPRRAFLGRAPKTLTTATS